VSVVIGQLQVEADGETTGPRAASASPRAASPAATAAPTPAARLQALALLRHQRERLARVRSS
jgi:hypothetical protein